MAQLLSAGREVGAAKPPFRARVLPQPLPDRRRSATPALLALSLAAHLAVIGAAALLSRPMVPPPPAEVAVEVVSEVPEEAKKPPAAREGDAAGSEAAKAEAAKAEAAKADGIRTREAEAATPEPVKPPEPTAAERVRAAEAQAAEAKAAEAKAIETKAAEAAQARAEQAKAEQARAERAGAEQDERQAMRDELARLRAERETLTADASRPAGDAPSAAPAAPRGDWQAGGQPAGVGPLASSFQAIALPQESNDGEGDIVGYQAIVFSRLAKAKAVGRQLGIPGSAGVSFAVDEHGALASLRLAVSSGIKSLDEEALAIVRKAAPFPVPPAGAQRSFEANVSFVAGG